MSTDRQRRRQLDGHVLVADQHTAGFKLLDKFTSQWQQLHQASEAISIKSRLVLDKLGALDQSCKSRLAALDSFVASYKSFSQLERQLANISCDISSLEATFVKIEHCLSLLAERKEQLNCDEFIRQYQGNFEAQVQREKIMTELKRDQLMADHLRRVQDFERQQQQALEERRRVLTNEFEAEKAKHLEKRLGTNFHK